jgi:hypothetical protein
MNEDNLRLYDAESSPIYASLCEQLFNSKARESLAGAEGYRRVRNLGMTTSTDRRIQSDTEAVSGRRARANPLSSHANPTH